MRSAVVPVQRTGGVGLARSLEHLEVTDLAPLGIPSSVLPNLVLTVGTAIAHLEDCMGCIHKLGLDLAAAVAVVDAAVVVAAAAVVAVVQQMTPPLPSVAYLVHLSLQCRLPPLLPVLGGP